MSVLLFLALFLSLVNYSRCQGAGPGAYCICKSGAQDPTAYQRVIDYACGAGADCRAVQQNGPCYVANNLKAICDYAVNSYYQNKGRTADACVFSGAATPSNTLPSTVPSGCTFPTSGGPVTGGGVPGSITTGTGAPGSITTGGSIFSPPGLGPAGGIPDYNTNSSPSSFQLFKGTLFLLTLTLSSGLLVLRV